MLLLALLLTTATAMPIEPAAVVPSAVEWSAPPSIVFDTPTASNELDLAALDDLRGGDGSNAVIITDQMLKAVNTGNTVSGQTVGSGDIAVGAGAFDGFAGIGNFAINTGHNNNLQSSVSVSIIVTPPTVP